MTTILCTLYNSLYLDKGLVLYDSLCECAKDFKLYVLCMDDKCYEVLTDLKQEHHIPVRLGDFEEGDEALLAAKANRTMGEYCWTCSSSFIRYVLMHYNEDICTYIDADMYFYNDPQVLIDEMLEFGKSVMVVPHRFPKGKAVLAQKVGTYCVEFNTFLNTPNSLEVLEFWRNRCLDCCSNLGDGLHWGDQKYLDELVEQFDCVHVCENNGAGVAPWNILSYNKKKEVFLFNDKPIQLIFYHYQGIVYVTKNRVSIGIQKNKNLSQVMIIELYDRYLLRIKNKRSFLIGNYNNTSVILSHPSNKQKLSFIKKTQIGSLLRYLYIRLLKSDIILAF